MKMEKYDFSGWATRNNLKCSDGRTIIKDAFKDNDGQIVPLVWNHQHNDPSNVLGHAMLKNEADGVRAYGVFNDTESGTIAKALVQHGDIDSLSIYANQLKEVGANVLHGMIREVSLVHAGANPGAYIDEIVMAHSDEANGEAIVYSGMNLELSHADKETPETKEEAKEEKPVEEKKEEKKTSEDMTIEEVFNTLTEDQKTAVYAIVGQAVEDAKNNKEEDGGSAEMKHNIFDNDEKNNNDVISHSEMEAVINDAKRYGSMKESALAHGIDNIDYLFPEDTNLNKTPEWIKRDQGWVSEVMGAVHHTPFSRIKSTFANITEDDARAKGYIKGKLKKEEVFSLLKRSTSPTTVYKKQKLDRDDVIDITDFDVVAWIKGEMRMMLNEELARAYLIGDGRLSSSDDKINEANIRPVAFDDALYTIQAPVTVASNATADDKAKAFIKAVIKSRKDYKGSGNPVLYTTEDFLTDMLLLEDQIGHTLYEDEAKLAKKLRVSKIVTVPVMEGVKGKNGGDLMGIVVNLADYNVGADKGGAVSLFDDFDIDYNAQKYLIETRCSGALTVPYSAIALELDVQ